MNTLPRSRTAWFLALGLASVTALGCAVGDPPERPGEGADARRGGGLFPDATPSVFPDADEGNPERPDAREPSGSPDARVASACSAPGSFASLGALADGAGETGDGLDGAYDLYWGPLEDGMPGDHISLELWEGYGPFAGGLRTGTFSIAGDETDYSVCGLCAIIATDYDGTNYRDTYMAQSGSITITSVDGSISGTMSNVTFRHVLLDADTGAQSEAGTGCTTRITSASFTAPLSFAF